MLRTVRQFPKQPGVDGAEREVTAAGAFAGTGHMIEKPTDFAAGEVCVNDQAGLALNQFFVAGAFEVVAEPGCASVLPHDRVVDGFAGTAIPDHGGLALIRDADGSDIAGRCFRFLESGAGDVELGGPDFARIMFDPAGARINLAKFFLSDAADGTGVIEEDRAGTRGALIQSEDERHK